MCKTLTAKGLEAEIATKVCARINCSKLGCPLKKEKTHASELAEQRKAGDPKGSTRDATSTSN